LSGSGDIAVRAMLSAATSQNILLILGLSLRWWAPLVVSDSWLRLDTCAVHAGLPGVLAFYWHGMAVSVDLTGAFCLLSAALYGVPG